MGYLCCDDMNDLICFNADCIGVTHCTLTNATNGLGWPKVAGEIWENGKINWDKFFDYRDEEIKKIYEGNPRKECANCQHLHEIDELPQRKLKQVLLSPWQICNSDCVYCLGHVAPRDEKSDGYQEFFKIHEEPYDMLEIVKDMVDKKIIDTSAKMNFAGGEPTLYPKFDAIIDYLVDNKFDNIILHTNNIQYSKAVERGIKENCISLMISIDAGTKKCHEQVKRVVSFDKVWKNFHNYAKVKPKHYDKKLATKFVIVPGMNDSEKEIHEFVKKSKQNGATCVALNVYNQFLNNMEYNPKLMDKLYTLTEFFRKETQKFDIKCEIFPNLDVVYLKKFAK